MQTQKSSYGIESEFDRLDCGCPIHRGHVAHWPKTAPILLLHCIEHGETTEFGLTPLNPDVQAEAT